MAQEDPVTLDRGAILTRRREFIARLAAGTALTTVGCWSCLSVTPRPLRPGGLFVAHVNAGCVGCEALRRGDLIQSIDGVAVTRPEQLDDMQLRDGRGHTITYFTQSTASTQTLELRVEQDDSLAPIADPPPFWTVAAERLQHTPSWARRRLWGHASPRILLMRAEHGERINGRDLHGRRWLIVLFDHTSSTDRQQAALCLQVLQKAQADLRALSVELMFAQVQHPSAHEARPMNDDELRAFAADNQLGEADGGPLPLPPLYRMPNKTEDHPRDGLGLEGEFTYYEAIGEAPNIFVLDERGIICWHSAGAIPDPAGRIEIDMVYTINEAVLFARDRLSG